jgi:hypothetical protein
MTELEVVRRGAAQPSASRTVGLAGGAAVRLGSPAASGRLAPDSTIPTCDLTGEDVDDCPCVEADYDQDDEADARYHAEREERDLMALKPRREVRNLPCVLTDEEFLDRSRQLAACTNDIATETARQVDVKAQMKARLAGLAARQSRLASAVARSEEDRDVEVSIEPDENALCVRTYRTDTGMCIDERPMREDERQRVLPGVENVAH